LVVYAAVPALLVGAGLVLLLDDNDRSVAASAPPGCERDRTPTTEPPTPEEAAAAVELEAGMTSGQVIACKNPTGDATGFYPSAENCPPEQRDVIGEGLSYGIELENTGDQVLIGIRDLPIFSTALARSCGRRRTSPPMKIPPATTG
jgi:hypothetical protein